MKELKNLRRKIDDLDNKLLRVLAQRMKVVEKIGEYKKKQGLPALDHKRWEEVLESRIKSGKKLQLDESLIKDLFDTLHKHTLRREKN